MKISIQLETASDLARAQKIVSLLREKFPDIVIKFEGEISELPSELNLTKEIEEVLKKNRNKWLTARDIVAEIAAKYGVTVKDLEAKYGYKPGGLGKGVAASTMKLQREGKIVVNRSSGPGNYKYKWK